MEFLDSFGWEMTGKLLEERVAEARYKARALEQHAAILEGISEFYPGALCFYNPHKVMTALEHDLRQSVQDPELTLGLYEISSPIVLHTEPGIVSKVPEGKYQGVHRSKKASIAYYQDIGLMRGTLMDVISIPMLPVSRVVAVTHQVIEAELPHESVREQALEAIQHLNLPRCSQECLLNAVSGFEFTVGP